MYILLFQFNVISKQGAHLCDVFFFVPRVTRIIKITVKKVSILDFFRIFCFYQCYYCTIIDVDEVVKDSLNVFCIFNIICTRTHQNYIRCQII